MSSGDIFKKFIKQVKQSAVMSALSHKRQLWWNDNKMGGYDGYELEPGGKLFLLNWDLFTGVKWQMTPEGLYTEKIYKKNGNVLRETAEILELTEDRMVLKTVMPGNEFINVYEKITYGTIADSVYGHYTNGESYVQIIPVHEHEFQIVFSEPDNAHVVKHYGRFDERSKTLYYTEGGNDIVVQHAVQVKGEQLTVGDKKYYRPVF